MVSINDPIPSFSLPSLFWSVFVSYFLCLVVFCIPYCFCCPSWLGLDKGRGCTQHHENIANNDVIKLKDFISFFNEIDFFEKINQIPTNPNIRKIEKNENEAVIFVTACS